MASPLGEAMFLGYQRARAKNGNIVQKRRAKQSNQSAVSTMLSKKLHRDPATFEIIPGKVLLGNAVTDEYARCREFESDVKDGTAELAVMWQPEQEVQSVHIGNRIAAMEAAQPGLGYTFLAILEETIDALPCHAVFSPRELVKLVDCYEWDGAYFDAKTKGLGMMEVDAAVVELMFNERDMEPDDVSLPSMFVEGLAGKFDPELALSPKRQVEVTLDGLQKAGLTTDGAEMLFKLVQVELPKAIKSMSKFRLSEHSWDAGHGYFPAVVWLTDHPTNDAVQLIDDHINNRMESGEDLPVYSIHARATAYPKKRGKATKHSIRDAAKDLPVDSIDVMAAFLNLLSRTDQLLAALCG